jgi:hypothetical protein
MHPRLPFYCRGDQMAVSENTKGMTLHLIPRGKEGYAKRAAQEGSELDTEAQLLVTGPRER